MSADKEESARAATPVAATEHVPTGDRTPGHVLTEVVRASSAGTQARAAEPTPAQAHAVDHCANCGARVTSRYCAECGQRMEHSLHSLWHFILEVAEDLTHADSRLWRTMTALLLKPGFLTSEFLVGRRVRYLPPLRLYLVLSLGFFLISAAVGQRATLQQLPAEGQEVFYIGPATQLAPLPGETSRQHAERVCANISYHGPWKDHFQPAFRESCLKAVEDRGHALREAFQHNLPRAIFLTVPILALVMKPLYLRPRRYYVEHLLFLLHNHACLFLLFGLFSLIAALLRVNWLVVPLTIVVTGYVPYYYYVAMTRVYGQGAGVTLGKLSVLTLAYLVTALLVLLATSLYSVLAQ